MTNDEMREKAEKVVENTVDLSVGQAANLIGDIEQFGIDTRNGALEEAAKLCDKACRWNSRGNQLVGTKTPMELSGQILALKIKPKEVKP